MVAGTRLSSLTVALCAGLVASSARAADGGNLQRFTPEAAPLGGLATGPGEVLRDGDYAVGLDLNYARNALVLRQGGARTASTVGNDFTLQLHAAYGLFDRFELGLVLPVAAYVGGDDAGFTPASFGVGDVTLVPRIRLLTQWKDGLALAFAPILTIPLGGSGALAGDASVTITPSLTVSRRFGGAFFAGEAHFTWRPTAAVAPGAQLGKELGLKLAGGVDLAKDTELILEADGGLALATSSYGALGNPLELRAGVRQRIEDSWAFDLAAGLGVLSAPGTPDFRVIAGVTYGKGLRPAPGTSCQRETAAGPEARAARGIDTDGDGIDDACDLCPSEAENVNGYKDLDGCVDADRDGDGLFDDVDKCPTLAGPAPGGCPDSDGDGMLDDVDQCPDKAEDKDGFEDEDGCPDLDNDKDGVPDALDKCPMVPEDKDGFEDDDGCPEFDNDQDGIPDAQDKCPNEKETINGVDDDDGCPDVGKTMVVVKNDKIEILDKVYFATDQAVIEDRSFGLLKQVALTVRAHPEIKHLRVEGHTDDVGGHDHNAELSQKRAQAVVDFLVEQGAERRVLEPVGYASDRPLVPNKNDKNRAINRRVEFNIIDDGAKP